MDVGDRRYTSNLGDLRIRIVGLTRNSERILAKSVTVLERAFDGALEVDFFVVESNSSDRTLDVLGHLRDSMGNFSFVSLGHLPDGDEKRSERLAICRNKYLDVLNEMNLGSDSIVAVADLDGVNKRLSSAAVRSCFTRTDWDAVFANQRGRYYDIWALREDSWCPDNYTVYSDFLKRLGTSPLEAYRLALRPRQINIPSSAEWLPVRSAFGGLALYRPWVISAARYSGHASDGSVVSEHVPFHQKLGELGARMLINPQFINANRTEHTGWVRLLARHARHVIASR